jgi:uncharacterized protein YbaR (Trm112 family)
VQLLLTDRLACPRCGPEFGLILLAHELVERRVLDGALGCPNCRDSFEIRAGFADLRPPPRDVLEVGGSGSAAVEADETGRLAALLGLVGGPGTVALVGRPARYAASLADQVEGVEFVAVDPDARTWPERPGVSRMVAGPGLPFFSRVLRGVVLDGVLGGEAIHEAARVVAPRSRVVLVDAPPGSAAALEAEGLSVLAEEGETVVAARG